MFLAALMPEMISVIIRFLFCGTLPVQPCSLLSRPFVIPHRIGLISPPPLRIEKIGLWHSLCHSVANEFFHIKSNGRCNSAQIAQDRAFKICGYCLHSVGNTSVKTI